MSVRSISGTIDLFRKKRSKRKYDVNAGNDEDDKRRTNDSGSSDDEDAADMTRDERASGRGGGGRRSKYEKPRLIPTGRGIKDIVRIRNKANQYSGSFSIIGLTRVFAGNPIERVIWFCILVTAIFLGFYMSWELTVKYAKKDVRTETSTVITDKNIFPTVTICVKPPRKKSFCDINIIENPGSTTEMEKVCQEYKDKKDNTTFQPFAVGNSMMIGPFKVSCQLRGTCDQFTELDPKFFKIDPYFHECLVWNYDANFFNQENRLDMEIEILDKNFNKDADDIRIYVNEMNVYLPLQENYLTTTLWQHYQLSFKKIEKERLPAPYPSKCVKNSKDNIFPGKYSLVSCMESKRCLDTFKKCGDSYDFCRPFIPENIYKSYYQKQVSILSMHECLLPGYYSGGHVTECDLPCHEVNFDIYGSSYHFQEDAANKKFRLSMRYENPYVYYKETEAELYSFNDLLGGVGGNIGLFCGFSMLSLVEIISYMLITAYAKGANKRLKRHEEIKRRSAANLVENGDMTELNTLTQEQNSLV